MGYWGVGLYENDMAMDVKDFLIEQMEKGKPINKIEKMLLQEYQFLEGDIVEESSFWLALADTEWNYGQLTAIAKEKAFDFLTLEKSRGLFKENPTLFLQRKQVCMELEKKLQSPQPKIKVIKKGGRSEKFHCKWSNGDVYAYTLKSENAEKLNLGGRSLLLQKIDEYEAYGGYIYPMVYIKITNNEKLPVTVEEFDSLSYIITWLEDYTFVKAREDSKVKLYPNEFGDYEMYKEIPYGINDNWIKENLKYVGNFVQSRRPQTEYVPLYTIEYPRTVCDAEFEERILEHYTLYNLREIYKRKGLIN